RLISHPCIESRALHRQIPGVTAQKGVFGPEIVNEQRTTFQDVARRPGGRLQIEVASKEIQSRQWRKSSDSDVAAPILRHDRIDQVQLQMELCNLSWRLALRSSGPYWQHDTDGHNEQGHRPPHV